MCLDYESLKLPKTSIFKWNGYIPNKAMHEVILTLFFKIYNKAASQIASKRYYKKPYSNPLLDSFIMKSLNSLCIQ